MRTLTYLATPYSHPDKSVMEHRFRVVSAVAGRLLSSGVHIYSPISHCHPMAIQGDLPRGWDFWKEYDEAILVNCKELIVLKQYGWEESKGVAAEVALAEKQGIPVRYMDVPGDLVVIEKVGDYLYRDLIELCGDDLCSDPEAARDLFYVIGVLCQSSGDVTVYEDCYAHCTLKKLYGESHPIWNRVVVEPL